MPQKRWLKNRHVVIRNIAYYFLYPYTKLKYGITIKRFKEQQKTPYLILYNHQTAFDQFFVGMSMKGPVYYLATEDIFSNGWVSSLIKYLVAPIPIKKQMLDINAVKTCIQIAKEGGTLAIAPEGNRTYSGKTEYINPAIASLAKKLKLPILLYRIEGGYGIQPRWSDVVRKGKMSAGVSEVITTEEIAKMSKEELFERIYNGLSVNEAVADNEYFHSKKAEYLERAIYVCPYCGLSSFESNGSVIQCQKCNRQIKFSSTTALNGEGFEFPFPFVSQWYDYQKDFINQLDVMQHVDKPIYTEQADIYEVILYKKKHLVTKNASISLFGDKLITNPSENLVDTFNFSDVTSITILGKNKLNIYYNDKVYQIKGGKRFNALKYVHLFNRYKNIITGDVNGKFLGL